MNEDYEEGFFYYNLTNRYKKILDNEELQFLENIFPLKYFSQGIWEITTWTKNYKDFWEKQYNDYDNYVEIHTKHFRRKRKRSI